MGFLAIGLASFLSYLVGTRQQRGWVLGSAEKVLYMLAGLRLLGYAFMVLYFLPRPEEYGAPGQLAFYGLSAVTGALIWVALGLLLRRVLPVIEESRTLV